MTARKMGPQSGKLVPCSASKHHGHHPERESCPECPPVSEELPVRSWDNAAWLQHHYGFDLDGFYWP